MGVRDSQARSTQPFRRLLADMVLWLALALLFLAVRVPRFGLFPGEVSQLPNAQAFMRCFNTGLRSDATAAMWAILPSLTLTLIGFFYPLGIWHRRVRQLTIVTALTLCAIIFVADFGYFAEYDNQFDHWIFGLVYDDRSAILGTIWKSYHVLLLATLIAIAVAISAWLLIRLCRKAEAADVSTFLGTKSARAITIIIVAIWAFVGARVWLGRNLAGLQQ